jgi:methionyl-tRNA formyltransferase
MVKRPITGRLKIGFFGDGLWASRAISQIVENSDFEIVFVTPRFDIQDDSLRTWAIRLGVPFLPCDNVNSEEFIEKTREYQADIFVSMSFDQILRGSILKATSLGFINCHAGALPFFRGRNPLNWALINGEKRFGVTVHQVDEGIDTGPIIVQNFSPIGTDDTYATLLKDAHKLCADSLVESLSIIKEGKATFTSQGEISDGYTYFSHRRLGDEWINWSWPSEKIHNLVRGITLPGPCARTFNGEMSLAVVTTEIVENIPTYLGSDGEVIGRDAQGVIVKTGSNAIRIVEAAALLPNNSLDVIGIPKFPVGTRLGVNMYDEFVSLRQRVADLEREGRKIDE